MGTDAAGLAPLAAGDACGAGDPCRGPATLAGVLSVNGREVSVDAAPGRRLVDVLRGDLGLTGTKVGCNAGDCGACTVLIDGRQACACLVPFAQVLGRSVLTVEGLAADPRLAALQRAFVAAGATQCGICTPGMLTAAAELASAPSRPTREQVLDRLGGVLCRCTGYLKIVEAVEAWLDRTEIETPAVEPGRAVGARVPKVDGPGRVDGSVRFAADGMAADALLLRVLRSPHAHARFRIGDVDAIPERFPGIRFVLTARDVPGHNAFGVFARLRDQPVLADGYVRTLGEAVAAVVGERDAVEAFPLDALPIEWAPLPPLSGVAAATAADAPALHETRPGNLLMRVEHAIPRRPIVRGAVVASGAFETSFVEHAYIEPEAGVARRVGDRIELFVSTQAPYMNRDEIAWVLGIRPEAVRIVPSAVGGGFGGKIDMAVQPLIAVAAWKTDRPVACVYTRQESMRSTTKRHPASIRATMSCDADGRLASYEFDGDFNTGPYASCGPIVATRVPIHAMGPYRVPAVRCATRAVHTNDAIAGAFRGFGIPQAAIAHEALIDELALALGRDPLAMRLANVLLPGDRTANGQRIDSVGMRECLERLRPAWEAQRRAVDAWNAGGPMGAAGAPGASGTAGVPRTTGAAVVPGTTGAAVGPGTTGAGPRMRRGIGLGCMWYGIGNTSQPNPSSMRIGVDRRGRVTLFSGAVDIGQGASTILAQVCADSLGIPVDALALVVGDTDRTLDAGKSSASRQAFVSGNAVGIAAADLLAKLRARVGARAGAAVAFVDGDVHVLDGGRRHALGCARLDADAEGMVVVGEGRFDPPTTDLDANHQGAPYASYAFGAQMALVEVDTVLATVQVLKVWAAHDVGRALNPTQVEGQIHGGIVQGIGLALMEEYLPGRTDNLHDYIIPTVGDVPEIEVFIVEAAEKLGPFGAKGVGEPALIPTAPAILNAIRDATGVRPATVPVTASRLWELLRARPAGAG